MKGINSSRKLEQATRENMVFMYIAAGQHPDHSTLSQFRKRNGEAFKKAASEFLQMLVNVGLVDLKTLAIDGTKLKANAAREKMVTAATAHRRIQVIDKHLQDMSEQMDRAEAEDNLKPRITSGRHWLWYRPPSRRRSRSVERRRRSYWSWLLSLKPKTPGGWLRNRHLTKRKWRHDSAISRRRARRSEAVHRNHQVTNRRESRIAI